MKSAIKKHLLLWPSRAARRFNAIPAFTFIELLVIIATLAILSAILLPALAGSRAQPRVTACAANFRQWAVSVNLYANDDAQGRLPRFDWAGGGGNYLWDVSTNFVPSLASYGLTVPMWFCPFRPNEFDAAQKQYGKPISTIQDLEAYFSSNPYNETVINHNWWVQRSSTGVVVYPPTFIPSGGKGGGYMPTWAVGTPFALYGFPKRLHDNAVAHVPFISDLAGSSVNGGGFAMPPSGTASPDPKECSPNTAHFLNGVLLGVNAAYADGHVEAHNQSQMNCGYAVGLGDPYWFY